MRDEIERRIILYYHNLKKCIKALLPERKNQADLKKYLEASNDKILLDCGLGSLNDDDLNQFYRNITSNDLIIALEEVDSKYSDIEKMNRQKVPDSLIKDYLGLKSTKEYKWVPTAKKTIAYIIAMGFGIFFYASGIRILSILGVIDPNPVSYSLAWVFDVFLTIMLFAGGPDVIHQMMSLVQETKNTQVQKTSESQES